MPPACRLVPRALYESVLPRFEAPAVTLQPLRREVLCLLCSESALTNHPPRLLGRCMDPPDEEVVLGESGLLGWCHTALQP